MSLIKDLAETWRIEIDKRRKQKEKYRIEYAFTSGGTKYYRFADITNLPYERGIMALNVYNEVEMRCSREFLQQYAKAVDDALTDPKKIDVFKVKQLNDILKDRLNLRADIELCYKLASIVYFDKTEKPEVYEPEYAAKKIAKWRKDQKVSDFFTQKPLKELMPFLTNAVGDFDAYSNLNAELNMLHRDLIALRG